MDYLLAIVILVLLIITFLHVYTHGFKWLDLSWMPEKLTPYLPKFLEPYARKHRPVSGRPKTKYQSTVGYAFDETAKAALEEANQNEQRYKRVELTDAERPKAATNAATLANIQRYNVIPNTRDPDTRDLIDQQIGENYQTAIQRVVADPNPVIEATNNGDLDGLMAPELIIDQAETFYTEWRDRILAANPNMTMVEFDELHRTPNFDVARETVRRARRELAANAAEARRGPVLEFQVAGLGGLGGGENTIPQFGAPVLPVLPALQDNFFRARPVYNDPQNVHDPAVVNHIQAIYNRIKNYNQRHDFGKRDDQILAELEQTINKHPAFVGDGRTRALQAYRTMLGGNAITSLNSNDTHVMLEVYKRVISPENADNREDLQKAFMESLADSVEADAQGRQHLVCVTGRCSRVLGSLTLLDRDEIVSRPPMTTEMVRNEALSKAGTMVKQALEAAPEEVRNGYLNSTGTEEVQEFETTLKNNIDETLRKEYSHLENRVLDPVVRDAQAGV